MGIDDVFSIETGFDCAEFAGPAVSGRWTTLHKQKTKRIGRSSSVASPMPKSVLSGGRENQLLME